MKTSERGIELIKKYEGCRLTAYRDAVGVYTIGYGHTGNVKAGQKITKEEANNFLLDDVARAENNVLYYAHKSGYDFNQNEFDALVSFAFNIGSIKQLTADGTRSKVLIGNKILEYTKAGGKVIDGLKKRRIEEYELFFDEVEEIEYRPAKLSSIKIMCKPNYRIRTAPSETARVVDYTMTDTYARVHGFAGEWVKVDISNALSGVYIHESGLYMKG